MTGEQRPVIEQVILFGLDDVSLIGIPGISTLAAPPTCGSPTRSSSARSACQALPRPRRGIWQDRRRTQVVPRPQAGDERLPRRHRRDLRDDPDLPVQRRGLHHLFPRQLSPAGSGNPCPTSSPSPSQARTSTRSPLRIAVRTGLKAKTTEEFKWMTMMYYLKYTRHPD